MYISYHGTSLINLSLLMSPAAMVGLDIGVGVGLQREKDGTFFQHTRKVALC
jgi:hypothetical protein